ncbi:MAG: pyridoxamine 5'-phosphate oxidase [Thermoleophilaceae bacterium]
MAAENPRHARPLLEDGLLPDPVDQFAGWFEEAASTDLRMPEAMAVATAAPSGAPSVRMALLKGFDTAGFVFYTSYLSRKARELDGNPRAALLFYWDQLGRQVRIEGAAERCPSEESRRYIESRPRGSRLSALASRQSEPVEGREALESAVTELAERYHDRELPVPDDWGGYRVTPNSFEFWQHREDRLHDRLLYTRGDGGWRIERLAP